MPTSLFLVLAGATAAYMAVQIAAAVGVWRTRRLAPPPPPDVWPTVSVVIPARDEADRIRDCIDGILACDYPDDRLQVVVVDDFSTDATAARVRAAQPVATGPPPTSEEADGPEIDLVKMDQIHPSNGGHKPAAVAQGIEAATGEIILTTDADCQVEPGWIRSMVRRCTPETPFVAGVVRYRYSHRYLERLQALAFAGLVAFGAGTLGLGVPTYCNSANIAVRRDVLEGLDAPEDDADEEPSLAEGAARDEMLLQHVAYATDRSVAFNPDPDAVVTTEPAPSLDAYLHQQARWASMGARYPFRMPRYLVVGMWAFHPLLLAALLTALVLPAWRQPALAALLGKMAADLLLTVPFTKAYDQNGLARSAVATELLLLFIVPLAGMLGSFGSLEWKGRPLDP